MPRKSAKKTEASPMGNDKLRLIEAELVGEIRKSSSVDWWRFDQRRKKISVAVKRLFRAHGNPPELQAEAINTVVMQAEAPSAELAASVL